LTNNSSSQGQPVLLDTNFLLLPFQRRIDIFEEIPKLLQSHVKHLILPQVFEELQWLVTQGSSREARAAQSAIEALNRFASVITDLPSDVRNLDADSALLHYAQHIGAIVATNDRDLRQKLITQGSRVIYLRKLAVLAITG
jgi:rRNA-processing protein FCF1